MIATDLDFPADLPYPQRNGYGLKPVQTFKRTEMDSGRARQRPGFVTVPTVASVSWKFTTSEAQIFEAWFRDVISSGAAWFNCPLVTPMGDKPYVCRFVNMYDGPIQDGICHWQYSANLELWEIPRLAPGWGEFPDFIRYADIIDLALNREWPEA